MQSDRQRTVDWLDQSLPAHHTCTHLKYNHRPSLHVSLNSWHRKPLGQECKENFSYSSFTFALIFLISAFSIVYLGSLSLFSLSYFSTSLSLPLLSLHFSVFLHLSVCLSLSFSLPLSFSVCLSVSLARSLSLSLSSSLSLSVYVSVSVSLSVFVSLFHFHSFFISHSPSICFYHFPRWSEVWKQVPVFYKLCD